MNGAVILFIVMFILIFMGVPVAFSIAASSSVFLLITQMKPLLIVPQRMLTGLDSFPYLAIPLFILVGNLMDTGGISRRLVNWANLLAGGLPGGHRPDHPPHHRRDQAAHLLPGGRGYRRGHCGDRRHRGRH